jgi:hypothetical protein
MGFDHSDPVDERGSIHVILHWKMSAVKIEVPHRQDIKFKT